MPPEFWDESHADKYLKEAFFSARILHLPIMSATRWLDRSLSQSEHFLIFSVCLCEIPVSSIIVLLNFLFVICKHVIWHDVFSPQRQPFYFLECHLATITHFLPCLLQGRVILRSCHVSTNTTIQLLMRSFLVMAVCHQNTPKSFMWFFFIRTQQFIFFLWKLTYLL